MKTTKKAVLGGLAMAAAATLLAGCGSAPADTGSADGGSAENDYLPCMVSDFGGFDDRSFNQLGKEGLDAAAETLGVETREVESQAETDYASNLQNLIDQNCSTIVTVGFALAPAALESANANPEMQYVSIDDPVDFTGATSEEGAEIGDGVTDAPNIKPLTFDTAQAAFLAGYLSAGVTETGIVGTFGGANYPTVTIFMEGFAQGVEYYNEQKGTSVQVLGLDLFTGGFEANDAARQAAQSLIDQNVDVLLPVGGPIYQSAAIAIRDAGREIALIGTDADVYESDPEVADLLLTSIRKGIDVATETAITEAGEGDFDAAPYVGTLENEGVSIAPFHDWDDRVAPELADEVEALQAAIIAGEITVESYLAE